MGFSIRWLSAALILTTSTQAQLVFFDFNTSPASPPATESQVNGTPTVVLSGADVDPNGQEGTEYTDVSGTAHPAGTAGAFQSGVNDGGNAIFFTVDTTGVFPLVLRYDYRSTAFGPTSSTLAYALPGQAVFTPFKTTDDYVRDAEFHERIWPLGEIGEIANAGEVRFRWSGFTGGSLTGTFRMDNLELASVPEPGQYGVLAGLALIGFCFYRRRVDWSLPVR